MLRSGGEIHERDEGRHRGDELEGYHRLSHVVAINAFTQKEERFISLLCVKISRCSVFLMYSTLLLKKASVPF